MRGVCVAVLIRALTTVLTDMLRKRYRQGMSEAQNPLAGQRLLGETRRWVQTKASALTEVKKRTSRLSHEDRSNAETNS